MTDAVFPIAVLLAVVNRAVIEYLAAPVRKRYPNADLWWLVYVSFVTGGAVGWLAGVNLFGAIAEMPIVLGRFLTAACIGGGANLLHDIAKRRNDPLPELDPDARYNLTDAGWELAYEARLEDVIRGQHE